jgi:hypothetical protein
LDLAQLRLMCLAHGVTNLQVLPAKVGVRSRAVVRMGPVELGVSAQMRVRRRYGSRAYNEETKEFRAELAGPTTAVDLVAMMADLFGGSSPSS